MRQMLMLLFVALGGMSLAIEAAILGPLGKQIGRLSASLSIFIIGVIVFSLVMLIRKRSRIMALTRQPLWLLTGGVIGFIYTIVLTITTPLVGVGTTMVGILCGQITASLAIDHFGILGSVRRQIDGYRIGALVLILIALVLIY
ncbi:MULTISPECIES: DMT family transporter [unclassified Psychrobacter]|uniref:DMT family transporter n=1 Tax=unclassified Psychrobacter TaxID=196806 RepID=UPI003F48DF99